MAWTFLADGGDGECWSRFEANRIVLRLEEFEIGGQRLERSTALELFADSVRAGGVGVHDGVIDARGDEALENGLSGAELGGLVGGGEESAEGFEGLGGEVLGGVEHGGLLAAAGVLEGVGEGGMVVAPGVDGGAMDAVFARDGGDGSAGEQAGEDVGLDGGDLRHVVGILPGFRMACGVQGVLRLRVRMLLIY